MAEHQVDNGDAYRIGAVSRLTGISPDTIRVWERRYGLVNPARAAGRFRLYSREDVTRLALVKRLVDAGHAIGSVAGLDTEQLKERLHEVAAGSGAPLSAQGEAVPSVVVIGEALPSLLRDRPADELQMELVGLLRDSDVREDVDQGVEADVLVIECPVVYEETVVQTFSRMRLFSARRAVVVYGFGARGVLERFRQTGIVTLRAPVGVEELRLAVGGNMGPGPVIDEAWAPVFADEIPPRRFDDRSLARLASIESSIRCECPNHMANILMTLNTFEAYSSGCENRNVQDARVHQMLHAKAARARAIMEEALEQLIEADQIKL